jgi:hypothetical protein
VVKASKNEHSILGPGDSEKKGFALANILIVLFLLLEEFRPEKEIAYIIDRRQFGMIEITTPPSC